MSHPNFELVGCSTYGTLTTTYKRGAVYPDPDGSKWKKLKRETNPSTGEKLFRLTTKPVNLDPNVQRVVASPAEEAGLDDDDGTIDTAIEDPRKNVHAVEDEDIDNSDEDDDVVEDTAEEVVQKAPAKPVVKKPAIAGKKIVRTGQRNQALKDKLPKGLPKTEDQDEEVVEA